MIDKKQFEFDLDYYTKLVEKWLTFNDYTLDQELKTNNITFSDKIFGIDEITIRLGFVIKHQQYVHAGLMLLMDQAKLKYKNNTLSVQMADILFKHKLISKDVVGAIIDMSTTTVYLEEYFFSFIAYINAKAGERHDERYTGYYQCKRLVNSTWAFCRKISGYINDLLDDMENKSKKNKKGQH